MDAVELVEKFAEKGYLLNPNVLKKYRRELLMEIYNYLPESKGLEVLSEEKIEEILNKRKRKTGQGNVEILFAYDPSKYVCNPTPKGWHILFKNRFEKLSEILRRKLSESPISIEQINKKTSGEVCTIGMVYDIQKTKTGKFFLTLEDPTGYINVLIPDQLNEVAMEITYDEVIAVKGKIIKKGLLLATEIIFPDVVNNRRNRENPIKEDVYAVFIGDTHVGSNKFLERVMKRFVNWLSLKTGSKKQKEIAEKVKYVFIVGDLVDGVGVYPEQEKELEIKDIYKQYQTFIDYFKEIERDDVIFVFIPGNHDGLRLAEPQPPFPKEFSSILYELGKDVTVISSNPTFLRIHNIDDQKGLHILLYHGYSIDYYLNNVPILAKFKYEKPSLVQAWFLKKRHLSPTYGAIPLAPLNEDLLVIDDDKIPDIFVTAHIHKWDVGFYNGVLLISTSCFQAKTTFQEKVGHEPTPGYAILVNLKNLSVKTLDLLPDLK